MLEAIQGSVPVDLGDERLILLPDRAIWWPARRTLIVSDVHLGKGTAFRHAGLPVPSGGSSKDLARISLLLGATNASRLVVLGDLIHARSSHQPSLTDAIASWRAGHAGVEMLLVRGNHDRSAGRLPAEWEMQEVEEPFEDGGLLLSHVPRYGQSKPVLAGHLHPVCAVRDFDRSTIRIPCFFFYRDCCILPAFGSFTGGYVVDAGAGQRCFVTTGKNVVRCGGAV